jgi:NTP pyrophosphatase (non-canonical NTP hydrolase)
MKGAAEITVGLVLDKKIGEYASDEVMRKIAEATPGQYQKESRATAVYPGANDACANCIPYLSVALAGETGEFCNLVKKTMRGDFAVTDVTEKLIAELGDILWYVAQACTELGVDMGDVMQGNLGKLKRRQEAGHIHDPVKDRVS